MKGDESLYAEYAARPGRRKLTRVLLVCGDRGAILTNLKNPEAAFERMLAAASELSPFAGAPGPSSALPDGARIPRRVTAPRRRNCRAGRGHSTGSAPKGTA